MCLCVCVYIWKPGLIILVNEILGDHNVDKQMTDSRGDVRYQLPMFG